MVTGTTYTNNNARTSTKNLAISKFEISPLSTESLRSHFEVFQALKT